MCKGPASSWLKLDRWWVEVGWHGVEEVDGYRKMVSPPKELTPYHVIHPQFGKVLGLFRENKLPKEGSHLYLEPNPSPAIVSKYWFNDGKNSYMCLLNQRPARG